MGRLVSQAVLTGKMLLQEAWKEQGKWDDLLPAPLAQRIATWWGALAVLPEFSVPRWLNSTLDQPVQLHVFSDASEHAFGCCIYLVAADNSSLLFAKTKVAPLKQLSLARLELQACMLGSDSLQFVAAELRLKVAEVHAWTDSLTALYWILGQPHRWKTWVANRVSTIQRTADKLCVEWHHCPGVDNPADLASRGAEITTLQQSFWQRGPTWLCTRDQWPQLPAPKPSDDSVKEVKLNAVQVVDPSVKPWWERMSSATKVKGVLRWILIWRYRSATRHELYASVDVVYQRLIQQQCFPQELHALQAGRPVSRESRISKHQPYLDDKGLIRATGRLQMADIDDTAKHPVILADCYLTTLLLRLTHLSRLHQGVEGCLAFLRRRYLILAGRRILRGVKDACVICRRHDGSPATEAVAPLPADRVVKQRLFAVVGVDHAGPLQVKDNDQSAKAWILLFVCATTRAVHLELVMSLSTSDFLHGYRRFATKTEFMLPQVSYLGHTLSASGSGACLAMRRIRNGSWCGSFTEKRKW